MNKEWGNKMSKEELLKHFSKWYDENANTPVYPGCLTEAQPLCIKELYANRNIGINRSFYQYVLDVGLNNSGVPKFFTYSSIDLLEMDASGDIVSVTPVDYEIIS